MSLGFTVLGLSHKNEPGAFPPNAANNGLSVDAASKKIVLGNNEGEAGDPAQLLSIREILLNNVADIRYIKLLRSSFLIGLLGDDLALGIDGGLACRKLTFTTTGAEVLNSTGDSNGVLIGAIPAP